MIQIGDSTNKYTYNFEHKSFDVVVIPVPFFYIMSKKNYITLQTLPINQTIVI